MKKMNSKKMTINDLAIMVARGFDNVQKQFDNVQKQFDNVQKQFDNVQKQFDNVQKQFGDMKESVDNKFNNLSHQMNLFRSEILGEFRALEKRIDVIEIKLDRIDKVTKEDILALGDEVYHIKLRTKKLEQKIAKLKLANS